MRYLNIWLRTLNYGGPEEGGWYYHEDDPLVHDFSVPESLQPRIVRSRYARGGVERPRRATPRLLARAQAWAKKENAARPPLHSVLSEGVLRVTADPRPSWEYPRPGRPYYE